MMERRKFLKGFTLIELLVVVSLIGVLATLVLANLSAARQRGRDAERKADLRNIQTALRIYYNDYGYYPTHQSTSISGCGTGGTSICVWGESFASDIQTYMSVLPDDPLPSVSYYYQRLDPDDYVLRACLENKSDEKGVEDSGASWCPSKIIYEVKP
ncbi:MAG: type II secretion system protein [Patescibacteria group bacterium]|jgi:prepilin-type N-terminal cleavage/methylation domain-containing protein